MMVKRVLPGAWDFGVPPFELIKTARSGLLRGTDLQQFIKRAGHQFVDKMGEVMLYPGEVPIHLIALGATEFYGPNRNGDGFKEATCRKFHHTFVTKPFYDRTKSAAARDGAYWYRNHLNKDPNRSYGVVKMSCFNEQMKRIELLVALNGTKEAADRNGGLVADRELEKIARQETDWGVSMACRVPYDICSGCGNKAASRRYYCTEQTCKYGGCLHNLTKVAADGHVLHVDNDQPTWFDISDVGRPADRVAWVMGEMQKAAAAGGVVVGGAQLAEQYNLSVPPHMRYGDVDDRTARLIKLAYEMADVEAAVGPTLGTKMADVALDRRQAPEIDAPPGLNNPYQALAHQKVALHLRDWLKLQAVKTAGVLTKTAGSPDAGGRLAGVFARMVADGDTLERYLSDRTCDPAAGTSSTAQHVWAAKLAEHHSVGEKVFQRRVARAIIDHDPARGVPGRRATEKQAANDPQAEDTARRFAVYQLYLLDELRNDPGLPGIQERIVRQNHMA